jgi:beta-N-acetylhexosaminidase
MVCRATAIPSWWTSPGQSSHLVLVTDRTEVPSYFFAEDNSDPPKLRSDNCRRHGKNSVLDRCRLYKPAAASRNKPKPGANDPTGKRDRQKSVTAAEPDTQTLASRPIGGAASKGTALRLPQSSGRLALDPKAEPAIPSEERLWIMAGQLFLSGFSGRRPSDPGVVQMATALREGSLSGAVINASNIESVSQLHALSAALSGGQEHSALIAIDQPGGPDSALSEDKGFSFYGAANAVSNNSSPQDAQVLYQDMAAELVSLGITLNIGPSGDICREAGVDLSAPCFGFTPSKVAQFAASFSLGHHAHGVLTALTHATSRPGLKPRVLPDRAVTAMLREVVSPGLHDAIIVKVRAIELPAQPVAALGYFNLDTYRLGGFGGALIIDLELGLSDAPMRCDEAILRALNAGADALFMRHPCGAEGRLPVIGYEAVRTGLASGRLRMSRFADAYERVQRLKQRLRNVRSKTQVAGIDR